MTQSHPLTAQSIPTPIQWAINVYGERLRRADALGDQMAKLEVRITETEKMRHHYATIGREHTTMRGDAELLLVMIQQACARVGIDVPLQTDRRLPRGPETRRAIGQSPAHPNGRSGDQSSGHPGDVSGEDDAAEHGDPPADATDDGEPAGAETERDPATAKDSAGNAADADLVPEPEPDEREDATSRAQVGEPSPANSTPTAAG